MSDPARQAVRIVYTNHRGTKAARVIRPIAMRFGSTQWHPKRQWLMQAWDYGKEAERTFALCDVSEWEDAVLGPSFSNLLPRVRVLCACGAGVAPSAKIGAGAVELQVRCRCGETWTIGEWCNLVARAWARDVSGNAAPATPEALRAPPRPRG